MKRREFVRGFVGAALAYPLGTRWASGAQASDVMAKALSGDAVAIAAGDIDQLAASLRGRVLLPGNDGYDAARRLWNGMFDRRPALIASCASPSDVRASVDFARAHGLLTAVRGGGHSATGKSSCDGGLMIDLSPMRAVRVDPDQRTARVEGGALLGDLDHETRAFGLVTTAGTVSHTGAGGLTLGGGLGRVGRHFGLACDNLVAADVVTADGRLLEASDKLNPDLFWGLRGGSGNFGVATSLEYRLHEMDPTILGGQLIWPIEQARDVLTHFAEFSQTSPDELNTDVYVTTMPGAPPAVMVELCWSGDAARGAQVIEPLRRFGKPIRDTVQPMLYVDLQRSGDQFNAYGVRHYGKAGFGQRLDADVIKALVDAFNSAPVDLTIILQQAGGAIGRVPVEATAFTNRDAQYWMMVMSNWHDAAEDERRMENVKRGWKNVEPFTSGYYVNALTNDEESRARLVYGKNYDRLVTVKNRYDPMNLFRLNANVLPTVKPG
jgi:FAD/FMN-containing dehydrogenase